LLTLFSFLILFLFRPYDDNRLTSWKWVFDSTDAAAVFLILLIGVIVAAVSFKVSFPLRNPNLFLFLASFIVSSFFWKVPEVIIDSSRYFTQAKHLEVYGIKFFFHEWGKAISPWTDLPLIPFIYGLIFKLFGESRIYVQIFTSLIFSLTAVIVSLIGKETWDQDTGFAAGLFLLGIPYLSIQVPLMLVDVPAMFFLTCAVYTFIRALNYNGIPWILLSSFAIFLAFFSKFSMWLMLLTLPLIFLISLVHSRRRQYAHSSGRTDEIRSEGTFPANGSLQTRDVIQRGAMIGACSCLLIGIVIVFKYDIFLEQMKILASYQKPGLRRWGESFISTFLFQIHPFITGFAIYSVWAAFKKKDGKYVMISWLVLAVILLQVKRIRYILPLFPMVCIMASYGLRQVLDRDLRRLILSCVLVSSLTIAFFAYLPFCQKMSMVNLKHAGELLNSMNIEKAEVHVLYGENPPLNPAVAVPILDLYTNAEIFYPYDPGIHTFEESVEKSPLRFTWEYKNPAYYRRGFRDSYKNSAIVILSRGPDEALPDSLQKRIKDYRLRESFKTNEGIFEHRIFVMVYTADG
jgi:hypothetical protein